jgi:hypothetical protein
MNSVVQILFSYDDFTNKYVKNYEKHVNSCDKPGPDCF